jgi:hypothetical protein
MMGVMVSPLRGADGNVEFLVHLRHRSADNPPADWRQQIEVVVAAAGPPAAPAVKPEG